MTDDRVDVDDLNELCRILAAVVEMGMEEELTGTTLGKALLYFLAAHFWAKL